jgi:hypothetical protein
MSKQQLADQTAQKNGFDYAVYLGERDGASVFIAGSNVPADTGLPLFILIDDQNNVMSDFTLDYMDMVKE